jgi:NNP family nitrate/nitrite transporter-like MFS transporter
MLGFLNFALRPLGGIVADLIYRRTHSVWAKKHWLTFLGIAYGVFLLAIGLSNPQSKATMFGLVAAYAFFMEAANGANFAVVPHVHPFANGIGSGH